MLLAGRFQIKCACDEYVSCPLTLLHVASDKQEQQCRQLMAGLDKVVSDLDKQEKSIYARVRPPLEQNRTLQDSTDRLQDMKVRTSALFFGLILKLLFSARFSPPSKECVFALCNSPVHVSLQDIAAAVRRIEPEKSSKVQEAQSFLVSNPNCASTSQLHSKVDEANKKYTKVEQLLQCSQEKYVTWLLLSKCHQCSSMPLLFLFSVCSVTGIFELCFRLKNSNQLESSLQNGKTLLSTYENKLAREEVAPADVSSMEKTQRELAVRWSYIRTEFIHFYMN